MEWNSPMMILLAAALVCQSPKMAECRVACLFEGYEGGYWAKDRCYCVDSYLYDDFLQKRIKKPPAGLQGPIPDERL